MLSFLVAPQLRGGDPDFFGNIGDADAQFLLQPLDAREVVVDRFQAFRG